MQYEQAFALLQTGKSPDEALERLNKALEYDPTFGDAYVLKSYVRLEVLPNLDEALSAAKLAVQYAPKNPDSHYTLGLIYEKRGQYAEAEQALREALVVNPNYVGCLFLAGRPLCRRAEGSEESRSRPSSGILNSAGPIAVPMKLWPSRVPPKHPAPRRPLRSF